MDALLQYAIIFLVALLVAYQIVSVRFALARVERKIAHIAASLHIDTSTPPPLSERVQELARHPESKREAIRRYSADTGLGLVESAAVVEAYLSSLES
jgi:cell division protein FtsL